MEPLPPIRILFVEDVPYDAELAEHALLKEGLVFTSARVETQNDFLAALATFQPDLIVSDYALPEFDGLQALKLSLEHDPALPVILMTGSLNEETAVACIKAGATDYVLKDRIVRLPFAVKEALAQKQLRLAKDAAERALRESEQQLRLIADNIPAIVNYVNAQDLRYRFVNRAYADMVGMVPEQIQGKQVKEILDEAAYARALPYIDRARSGERVSYENVVLDRGEPHWFNINYIPEFDAQGAVQGVIVLAVDITEHKQAEEALYERQQVFRTLVENSPDIIARYDRDCQRTYVNPVYLKVAQIPEQELLATAPAQRSPLPAASAVILQNLLRKVLDSGVAEAVDVLWPKADNIDYWYNVYASPEFDREGRVVSVMTISRDITERKQAEEALRQSEELFRVVLTNILDPVFITDQAGQFTFICPNVPAILGYSLEDIRALGNISSLVGGDLFSLAELETRGEITNIERVIVDRDGRSRVFLVTVKRVSIGRGTTLYAFHDITERKRAEEALQESERVKTELLEKLNEAQHIATIGSWEWNLQTNHVWWSDETYRIFGVTPQAFVPSFEANGKFIHPDDFASYGQSFEHSLQTGEPLDVDLRLVAMDGQLKLCQAKGRIIYDDSGQPIRFIGTIMDITKHKRMEEALRTKVAVLQMLADIDQAIISSLDLDRVLLILLEKVREVTQAEACSVALIEPATGDLVFRQAVGGAAHEVIGLRLQSGEGLAGWVAQQWQSVLVPDAAVDARAHTLKGSSGFVTRDLIGVPLIVHEQVTGVIELVNKRTGAFSEDDRRLLEAVAVQAAIAIENARLFETEHAGRESLETLYRIGQAINSTLDADTILDRLTDEALHVTHATHGSALVAQPDRGGFERRSLRGFSPEQVEQARADWLPLDRGLNGRAYHSRQPVYVADVRIDPDYHPLIPETRSELVVPILHGDQVVGNLDLQSPRVDAFHDANLEFLQALTDQVAIALENARLFDEARRRMDEMSIVSQVALVDAAGRPLEETIAHAIGALSLLWPTASLGFLFVDEGGQSLHGQPARHDSSPVINATIGVPVDQGLTGWAVRQRQPIRVGDVTADPRYLRVTPDTRSEMAAPLVAGQHVIGVINVESPALDAFSGDDLRLLTTLAGQLATIFEKARLDAELIQHAALLEQRVEDRTRELSLANDQLKELDRLKDQFVSNVSHELRTPLTSILLNLDLLDHGKPEKRPHYIDTLHREAERLRKTIEDLLDIARLDRQTAPVELASIDLHQLLGPLVADRATVASERGLTLDYLPAAELPLALAEVSMLTQVVSNLIANALNYTPAGGSVTLQTHQQRAAGQDWLTLTVRDTGPGIAAHELPHLFERFYRGEVGRKASAPGTGLGLAISREIMERLGGRITVESEPGQGTAFTVWLKPG